MIGTLSARQHQQHEEGICGKEKGSSESRLSAPGIASPDEHPTMQSCIVHRVTVQC